MYFFSSITLFFMFLFHRANPIVGIAPFAVVYMYHEFQR